MKKFVAFILTVLVMFSLCACGVNSNSNSEEQIVVNAVKTQIQSEQYLELNFGRS